MATRSKQFFMTLAEFCRWLQEAASQLSVAVIRAPQDGRALEVWRGTPEELEASTRVYIAEATPAFDDIDVRALQLGRLGWVQIDIPRESKSDLLLCQIAGRSDWFDKPSSEVHENPAVLKLYDRIWKSLKARLSFPVWVRNEVTGDSAPYHSIGYSEGAAERFRRGHRLLQEGVGNLRFEIQGVQEKRC